jgi:hypothetical protein
MRNTKKGAAQVKFDTTAHDYGRKAVDMTPKERSEYREGQKIAVSFAPVGGLVAKITSKILTSMPKIAKVVKAIKPKTKISKPKPKEIKYQKSYHENEILEPKSGYYRSDAKGWPLPIDRKW